MKLSLISFSALALLGAACLAGCGSSSKGDATPGAKTPEDVPVATPSPTVRKLVDGTAQATSPVNLLTDPGFALVSQGASYVGFLAFEEESSASYELATTIDSRSPAGFGGAAAIVSTSDPVIVLARIPGGEGPFRAQVWVSRSDTKGMPAPADGPPAAVTASLTEESPDGKAFDLAPDPGSTTTNGGRTWVLHRAEVTTPMPYGGFLVLRTEGHVQLAAPEVTSAEIVAGAAVRSRSLATVHPRGLRAHERAAIRRFRSIKPSLVPASPQPPR